jgi:DNA-binding response OmpR family regulator
MKTGGKSGMGCRAQGSKQGYSKMHGAYYADATVLLFDRKRHVRKQTRSVLNVLGFKNFLEFGNMEELRNILHAQRTDVAVLALDTTDCGVLKLIEDIRSQRCALDPFVPILLTTWDAKMRAVASVIESGADDVLLHPFSTAQMGHRIETLVHSRKPFVVTERYFGPDRRSSAVQKTDPTSIVVPNALQAAVSGNRNAAPNASRIDNALGQLRRLKLRNISRNIWYRADKLHKEQADPTMPDRYVAELAGLRKTVTVYKKTLSPTDPVDLSTLCDSLAGVLAGLFGQPVNGKGLFLLEQSALALRVASKLDHEESDAGDAISDAVAKTGRVQADLIRAVMG